MRRRLTLLALPVIAVLLTACGPSGPQPSPTPSRSTTSSATASATPSPTPTATPTPSATPIAFGCDTLLSAQDVYDFNPNFGTDPGYAPTGGTAVADVVALDGLACAWLNQTSGEVIEVAVAEPAAPELAKRKDAAAAAGSAAAYGYFSSSGGVGVAQAFTDRYWVVARSTAFFEAGDAAKLMGAAVGNLP